MRSPDRALARLLLTLLGASLLAPPGGHADPLPVVPKDKRGTFAAEREGTHDAANMRTMFKNFGMVGGYPENPGTVDLSVFHSVEVPKGTGMNYSDGITPFVLAKIHTSFGDSTWIMETGFRERQATSPFSNRVMRFEPRPGYFQEDQAINKGRSPAMSHDPRTWPARWPDRLADPDTGWAGSWDGYFGKRAAADQESFTVMDDNYYDAFAYYPDSRDSTRRGLGLRVNVRGFQWANPQAGNVIFWHYDITNESTTDYDENIIFGLYMDSGVGGSAYSQCDQVYESDDDNAFFDKSFGLNLVYTFDNYNHGVDLVGPCERTGYLGYAYLETPGNALNGVDDDNDGFVDERRDDPPGTHLIGQQQIFDHWAANYDTAKFTAFYGSIADRPAYRFGSWWTGDEDMDWRADFNDLGGDGIPDSHDAGEGDGTPTEGEPNFNRTDLNESDQIGLTGFKMNRIRSVDGFPTDGILFYTDDQNWPSRLYEKFSDPIPANRFDDATVSNYNIGFLFASGPFFLKAGQTERFSLALAYGADLTELRETVHTVQLIYNANYQFAVPPPPPRVTAEVGDRQVRLSWNDDAERAFDPVTNQFDFEGYRIYRSTDPTFLDPKVVTDGRGNGPIGNGKPIAQFDLVDGRRGYSKKTIEGVAYWLGTDTGITHTWTDTTVVNGQQYYYAVCAYDFGNPSDIDSLAIYPSENSIPVSRTPRGGLILPVNVVAARPEPRVPGYTNAIVSPVTRVAGTGTGGVEVAVVNSSLVPDNHLFEITFTTPAPDSFRADAYTLRDSTTHQTLFTTGADFTGTGRGPVGAGLMPVVFSPTKVVVDSARTGFTQTSTTTTRLAFEYNATGNDALSPNEKRPGYPEDFRIEFLDTFGASGIRVPNSPIFPRPAKFRVIAETPEGDVPLKFGFLDLDGDSTISGVQEQIVIVTYSNSNPTFAVSTWTFTVKTLGTKPRAGDVYILRVIQPLNATDRFVFSTTGAKAGSAAVAGGGFAQTPYVVPNPYIGAASFEPERFAISGRGERRMEFRAIPLGSTIRIYTVRGDLVRTLQHNGSVAGSGDILGSDQGFVAWDLRTKDNLDVAPGLYVYQVEAPGVGTHVGKFAIIK